MRHIWLIFKRELAAYFTSPIAYFVAFAILILCGVAFNNDLAGRNGRQATDGAIIILYLARWSIFFIPLITMRLFAEENREKTMELLMTLPIKDNAIVFGKFLGAWAYYTGVLALTLIYQAVLVWLSPPDMGNVFSAYLGVWLFGGAAIAIGMFCSALNENQIVAAFLGVAVLLLLWQADSVGEVVNNSAFAEAIRALSFQTNFIYSFGLGLVRLDHTVFFLAVMGVMIFLTIQLVESRRWR
ncbi:MAG TPA: ABC transporter permease [Aggregatilineales bacterium]|nr:ABC transporter permease [Anaerolineales bacterium]HRE46485.1 ABC transporter permease [Aggregatilineales bacterium]